MNKYYLSLIFGVLGYIFTTRKWILFLNSLNPIQGCIVYYMIIYSALYSLQSIGLIIANIKFDLKIEAFALMVIIFSFFILFEWESCYINYVTNDISDCQNKQTSIIYNQSEDGSIFYVFNTLLKFDLETSRILTYVVTPMMLTTLGLYLIGDKSINMS